MPLSLSDFVVQTHQAVYDGSVILLFKTVIINEIALLERLLKLKYLSFTIQHNN